MDANRALNFYPRPPRGGRRGRSSNAQCPSKISIHALREEGDTIQSVDKTSTQSFLSTPSARRATSRLRPCLRWYSFLSTPSARRATTTAFRTTTTPRNSFLSTPSARRATYIDAHLDDEVQFLSTPSARRATQGHSLLAKSKQISIHALREEGDSPFLARRSTSEYFYPRPPRGGRRQARSGHQVAQDISIHALREEGDAAGGCSECAQKNFYPRPPRGGRQ